MDRSANTRTPAAGARVDHESDLSELREAISLATGGVHDSMERTRLLVRDAVARLLASFSTLRSVVGEQRELLLKITSELHVSGGAGLAETTIQLLNEFVAQVVRVSHESMRMIERLENTSGHVDSIVRHANRIDTLARETRFIALNARIETHRAGAGSTTFKVVADEVKRLAGASAELSTKIRGEVSACHERLGEALTTASALAGHDMTTAIESHDTVVELIRKLDAVNDAMASTLKNVDAGISDAIRALQFEDMVNQLIGDAIGKLRKFGLLMVDMAESALDGNSDLSDVCQAIRDLGRPGSVEQTSLEQGSVELF